MDVVEQQLCGVQLCQSSTHYLLVMRCIAVGSSNSNEQLSTSASVMSSGTEPGAESGLVPGASSSTHISADGTTYMLDEAVSALPRQMTALSISTVATAGTSDPGDNGLSTPQSSITSDTGLPVTAYQLSSQVSASHVTTFARIEVHMLLLLGCITVLCTYRQTDRQESATVHAASMLPHHFSGTVYHDISETMTLVVNNSLAI